MRGQVTDGNHRDHDNQNIRRDDFHRVSADDVAPVAESDEPVVFL